MLVLSSRIAIEFLEWQANAAVEDHVGAEFLGRGVALPAGGGHHVILIDAVTADAEAADENL